MSIERSDWSGVGIEFQLHVAVAHIQLDEVRFVVKLVPQLFECWYDVSGAAYGCVCSPHVEIYANLHRVSFGSKNEVGYPVGGSLHWFDDV